MACNNLSPLYRFIYSISYVARYTILAWMAVANRFSNIEHAQNNVRFKLGDPAKVKYVRIVKTYDKILYFVLHQ